MANQNVIINMSCMKGKWLKVSRYKSAKCSSKPVLCFRWVMSAAQLWPWRKWRTPMTSIKCSRLWKSLTMFAASKRNGQGFKLKRTDWQISCCEMLKKSAWGAWKKWWRVHQGHSWREEVQWNGRMSAHYHALACLLWIPWKIPLQHSLQSVCAPVYERSKCAMLSSNPVLTVLPSSQSIWIA